MIIKRFSFIFLMSILFSCLAKSELYKNNLEETTTMKQSQNIVYFHYQLRPARSNGVNYEVVLTPDKTVTLLFNKDAPSEKMITTSRDVFVDLAKIVDEYKMYKYKGFYEYSDFVLDGEQWSFELRYEDDTVVKAHGYVKYPQEGHKAFNEIETLLKSLIEKNG